MIKVLQDKLVAIVARDGIALEVVLCHLAPIGEGKEESMCTHRAPKSLFVIALAVLSASACNEPIDEIDGAVPSEQNLLVGTWEWVDASVLVVHEDLAAEQTSVFYHEAAAPSAYTLAPWGDALFLEGWFATSGECAPVERCDQGRLYQGWFMTYYVDDEVFVPFALEEVNSLGADRVFEGQSVRLDRLDPQDEALSLIEQDTWTLALSDAGRYHYTALRTSFMDITDPGAPQLLEQERQEVLEETSGHYTLIGEALVLTPDDEAQAKVESIFRDGVISLDGLVFRRR